MNGRIEGYAHGFETWEDALTVGPQITWYPLPFQKVRGFIDNAAGDRRRT
jgi:hypothetical protein